MMQPCEQTEVIKEIKTIVENHGDRLHLGDLTLQEIKTFMGSLSEKLEEILTQTTATNGRVTRLERCIFAIKCVSLGVFVTIVVEAMGFTEFLIGMFTK